MPDYTCLYIGPFNAVVECGIDCSPNSAEAIARTDHVFHSRAGLTAIEIWHEGRMETRLAWTDILSRTAEVDVLARLKSPLGRRPVQGLKFAL